MTILLRPGRVQPPARGAVLVPLNPGPPDPGGRPRPPGVLAQLLTKYI
jgi:hypothetical protein